MVAGREVKPDSMTFGEKSMADLHTSAATDSPKPDGPEYSDPRGHGEPGVSTEVDGHPLTVLEMAEDPKNPLREDRNLTDTEAKRRLGIK